MKDVAIGFGQVGAHAGVGGARLRRRSGSDLAIGPVVIYEWAAGPVVRVKEVLDHTEYLAVDFGGRCSRETALFGFKSDLDKLEI